MNAGYAVVQVTESLGNTSTPDAILTSYEGDSQYPIPARKQPKTRPVGSLVAYREGFTNIVRRGTVVSVNVVANGYPVTRVNFQGWKGEIEFAVEALADGDQFDTVVNWWAS